MPYAFVQDKTNTFTSTIVPTGAFTAGNLVIVLVQGGSATTLITISDTVNNYSPLANIVPGAGANVIYAFYCLSVAGGSPTITVSITGATTQRIYIAEYSGLASFSGGSSNFQNSPGIGANVIVGGNINVATVPAMLWGYVTDASGTESPSAGTSPIAFNARTNVGSICSEDARIGVGALSQVTFGNTSNHAYTSISAAFAEVGAGVTIPLLGQACL